MNRLSCGVESLCKSWKTTKNEGFLESSCFQILKWSYTYHQQEFLWPAYQESTAWLWSPCRIADLVSYMISSFAWWKADPGGRGRVRRKQSWNVKSFNGCSQNTLSVGQKIIDTTIHCRLFNWFMKITCRLSHFSEITRYTTTKPLGLLRSRLPLNSEME